MPDGVSGLQRSSRHAVLVSADAQPVFLNGQFRVSAAGRVEAAAHTQSREDGRHVCAVLVQAVNGGGLKRKTRQRRQPQDRRREHERPSHVASELEFAYSLSPGMISRLPFTPFTMATMWTTRIRIHRIG